MLSAFCLFLRYLFFLINFVGTQNTTFRRILVLFEGFSAAGEKKNQLCCCLYVDFNVSINSIRSALHAINNDKLFRYCIFLKVIFRENPKLIQ